jgi:hypothetical protein
MVFCEPWICLRVGGERVNPPDLTAMLAAAWFTAAVAGAGWAFSLVLRRSSLREWMVVIAFWAVMTVLLIGIAKLFAGMG